MDTSNISCISMVVLEILIRFGKSSSQVSCSILSYLVWSEQGRFSMRTVLLRPCGLEKRLQGTVPIPSTHLASYAPIPLHKSPPLPFIAYMVAMMWMFAVMSSNVLFSQPCVLISSRSTYFIMNLPSPDVWSSQGRTCVLGIENQVCRKKHFKHSRRG